MPMTIVVTRCVPMRFRGFLASCMLEAAPGVYSHPKMSRAVRDRVWNVLESWWHDEEDGRSIVMLWQDSSQPGEQGVKSLGTPTRTIFEQEGVLLSRFSDDI